MDIRKARLIVHLVLLALAATLLAPMATADLPPRRPHGPLAPSPQRAGTTVLLVQDEDPCQCQMWQTALIAFDEDLEWRSTSSDQLASEELSDYDLVIVGGEQDGEFRQALNGAREDLEEYIESGGRVFYDVSAIEGADTGDPEPPFFSVGVGGFESSEDTVNYLIDPSHPLWDGVHDTVSSSSFVSTGVWDALPGTDYAEMLAKPAGPSGFTTYEVSQRCGGMVVTTQRLDDSYLQGGDLAPVPANVLQYLLVDWCPRLDDDEHGETSSIDADGDCVHDDCDNCPDHHNPGQEDTDYPGGEDGTGDACCIDRDRDGYGDDGEVFADCPSNDAGDCDDNDMDVHPGQVELCDDQRDNDCDGLVDQEDDECPSGDDPSDCECAGGGLSCAVQARPSRLPTAVVLVLVITLVVLGLRSR